MLLKSSNTCISLVSVLNLITTPQWIQHVYIPQKFTYLCKVPTYVSDGY